MRRNNRHEIKVTVGLIGKTLGVPTSLKEANEKGAGAYLEVDHYSPGGNPYTYQLCAVATKGGASWPFENQRMTAYGFTCYLSGLLAGIEAGEVNGIRELVGRAEKHSQSR